MNNLLRTLTESQAKSLFPEVDLRLLLSTVKEGRSQDTKLSDPFYDSLEGLLQDLRTITPDNRDAEAFLRPVSKADVPDYHGIIANPMDLQTMLKKVKLKQYKSKREFQDDLDLIWSNCFMYNTAENHPLRQCARRLKMKAESLLKNITDRKERTDPVIPPELGHSQTSAGPMSVRIRINGSTAHVVNGAMNGQARRVSIHSPSINGVGHSALCQGPSVSRPRHLGPQTSPTSSLTRSGASSGQDIPFPETPALVRTQEGMTLFSTVDKELEGVVTSTATEKHKVALMNALMELAPPYDYCEGVGEPVVKTEPDEIENLSAEVGEKRKHADQLQTNQRPRKRARFSLSSGLSSTHRQPAALPLPLSFTGTSSYDKDSVELMELWWGAVQSDALLANGLPRIRIASSRQCARTASKSDEQAHTLTSSIQTPSIKHKARHKSKHTGAEPNRIEPGPMSLFSLINSNIKTMKRVRHTHARFASLIANTTALNGTDEPVDGLPPTAGTVDGLPSQAGGVAGSSGFGSNVGMSATGVPTEDDHIDVVNDRVDEKSWLQHYIDAAQSQENAASATQHLSTGVSGRTVSAGQLPAPKVKKKGKRKRRSRLPTGIDMGEEIADGCVRWMGEKVLEHVGFQGASKVALDVLTGVAKEYLYNVGRTINFMTDKYSQTMTAEEIILHTLFESGTSKIQDLERYITDDIRRHGTRLCELERKLVGAYRETTSNEVLEDEGLFEEEEEEETGALAVGDFADLLGEDYLGLRELGIAAEFGMSSLTIPKKLLRGKKPQKALGAASKPKEPPPPYPPPPPFLPLSYGKLDDQIGLLKPYYQSRFTARASALAQETADSPLLPGLQSAGTPAPDAPQAGQTGTTSEAVAILPDLVLPDDLPNPLQVKIGPVGQIIRPSTTSGPGKKKVKGAAPGSGGQGGGQGGVLPNAGPDMPASVENSPKKKKGITGMGSGNGRKKKADQNEMTQSPVPPPAGFNQSQSRPGQGKGVIFPPVVVASA
ncbi:hypothetical protein APHAL10511_003586 [Amanita phalloides]|nr:hypothetical protein APHAL10511_003586 [Amanita phalloides]